MIQVRVEKQNECIVAFHIEGHSGYAKHGSDIICSAVSALAITCVNSIEQLTEDEIVVEQEEKRGLLAFELPKTVSEQSRVLLESLMLGLQGVSDSYGKQYVTVEIVRRK